MYQLYIFVCTRDANSSPLVIALSTFTTELSPQPIIVVPSEYKITYIGYKKVRQRGGQPDHLDALVSVIIHKMTQISRCHG